LSETYAAPTFSAYVDTVTDLIRAGESFEDVADAIDHLSGLTEDVRAALWLLAFSTRAPGKKQPPVRAQLVVVE
jgi:hypothetical protein